MPPLEEMGLNDPAVLWRKTGENRNSEPVLAAPLQIWTTWKSSQSVRPGPNGEPIAFDAQVVSVDGLSEGDILWKGELTNWSGEGDLMEVQTVSGKDSVNGRVMRQECGLSRFRRTLPSA